MKKIAFLTMMLVLGMAMVVTAPASAFTLTDPDTGGTYIGPIKMKFSNWDYGTLYGQNTNINNGGNGSGSIDSWGILELSCIKGKDSAGDWKNVWQPTANEAIEGWFSGLSDDQVSIDGTGAGFINSVAPGAAPGGFGHVEMYLSPGSDLTASSGPQTPAAGDLTWTPNDIYNATNGPLLFAANFVPGAVWGDNTTVYHQTITSMTNPTTGHGTGYLDIVPGVGTHDWLFNSNSQLNGTDLWMENDFVGPGSHDWTVDSEDPVIGYATPEPATLLIFGMGLLGTALVRRKRS